MNRPYLLIHGGDIVILVVNLTYNLLDYILKGDNALCAAIFIHNYGDVYLPFTKILKKIINHP